MEPPPPPVGSSPPPTLTSLFSTRRPRDWKAGLKSGAASLVKGVAGGAVGLVAAPVVGAATKGAAGCAKGLAAGVMGAVALPVLAAGVAVTQVARGIANTPAATAARAAGLEWDRERRVWVDPAGALAVDECTSDAPAGTAAGGGRRQAAAGASSTAATPSTTPSDDLYSLLSIPRDASPDAVRKGYLLAARRLHPDRPGGGDAAAFAAAAKAYSILSDPARRAHYDAVGAIPTDGDDEVDPTAVFAALFCAPAFGRWVGESAVVAAARSGGTTPADAQAARVTELTELLVDYLAPYEAGEGAAFCARAAADGAALAHQPWGAPLLNVIADAYAAAADTVLRGPMAAAAGRAVHATRRFGARARAVGSAVRAAAAAATAGGAAGLEAAVAAGAEDDVDASAAAAALPAFLDAGWRANKVDVWTTVDAVAAATLARTPPSDDGPSDARGRRARALRCLADAFAGAAAAAGDADDRAARTNAGAARARLAAAAEAMADERQRARDAADEAEYGGQG